MIIVPQHHSHATARSRALTERLRSTIAEFRHREPKVSDEEVLQALRDAAPSARGAANRQKAALVAVIAGITTAIGLGLVASNASNAGRAVPATPLVAIAVAGLGVVAAIILRARNDQ